MKVAIIFGTRPEIIKMSPVIKECQARGIDYFLVHSGQHYSYELDKIFFEELEIKGKIYNLEVGSGTHGKMTAKIIEGCETIFMDEKPDVILVEGDTNTVLGAALAASKLKILIGHIEAGLRSYDRNMPEETNRIITDHISDFCFAPTELASNNLKKEGINGKIFITGNTIVDALLNLKGISEKKSNILENLGLVPANYILVTAHREENVDQKEKLRNILKALEMISSEFNYKIIFSLHPRTKKKIEEFDLDLPKGVRFIIPVGYLDFMKLESNAKLIITDSGGIQEEACILQIPCVTIRENTERPETIDVGANILAGTDPRKIFEGVKIMINMKKEWINPFGDGKSSEKIINILQKRLK